MTITRRDDNKMRRITDNEKISRNIEKAYNDKKYIVSWKSVYQPFYSQAQDKFYATEVYRSNSNMTLAGRYYHMTAEIVNHLIGLDHFAEL